MGTILVKSTLNALKIEVFKKIFFSLKKLNFVAHFLLLTFSENFNFWTTLFLGDKVLITGPSNFGAMCPSPTFEYTYSRNDYCCCSNECCWNKCKSSAPPADCLKGYHNFRYMVGHSWVQLQLGIYKMFQDTFGSFWFRRSKVAQFWFSK